MACGLFGLLDSQHHWFSEYQHPATATIRATAQDKVLDFLLELRRHTKKTKNINDLDLVNIADTQLFMVSKFG